MKKKPRLLFAGFGRPGVPDTPEGHKILAELKKEGVKKIREDAMRIAKLQSLIHGTDVLDEFHKELKMLDEFNHLLAKGTEKEV